ncbi:hypothetical protein Goklo_028339, partial [Gossypium klotzschianum]|nr:hypothetical protein [Gossypium klotzschianum]
MKKMIELSILSGIDACANMNSPYASPPE